MDVSQHSFMAALEATWPAAEIADRDGWRLRRGEGGGNRVSAASALGGGRIDEAEAAMRDWGQAPLFQLTPEEEALDADLAARGYAMHEPVVFYAGRAEAMAGEADHTGAAYRASLRPAIMEEVWDAGGIGPARRAIMDRVQIPFCFLLGRMEDRPCGAAFVAVDGDVAMIHAIEVRQDMRRKGVAALMMDSAARFALEAGAVWLTLAVVDYNAPARTLYEKLGMTAQGRYHYRILKEAW
ncbi:MAG: GNAT family N-acetyltransferase [Pseudomonadota bacterium]